MKFAKKVLTICMVLALCLSMLPAALAADSQTATIDTNRKATFDLYKYDSTSAGNDGVWTADSYVSTGFHNTSAETALKDYALQGVVFTYVKVADITTSSVKTSTGHQDMVLYAMDKTAASEEFLDALGLCLDDAQAEDSTKAYFDSELLIDSLSYCLNKNATSTKNALESFVNDNGGVDLPETDASGHTGATELDLGLYLVVETYVPENVTVTTAPFLVSLPMTTIDGKDWNYNVVVYPKNETGAPTLEKELRESAQDTGKSIGLTDSPIDDGYNHMATGSTGDVVEYQILSTLPSITSNATALSTYTFVDTLSKGIEYNKNDVVLEWFKDAECTQKVATWAQTDGKFTVTYGTADDDATTMTIAMTADGLSEINTASTVHGTDSLYRGYSDCTLRITYAATVNSSADTVYGDSGNPNTVKLTWKRTNTSYYDTLEDDCHFYVYGLDLTKEFNGAAGDFSKVQFVMHNATDDYWVVAELNEDEGVYYVTGHETEEAKATKLTPTSGGKLLVKGLEDDEYTITEVQTSDGFTLLKDAITVSIFATQTDDCPVCGKAYLRGNAKVNGDVVTMNEDNGSANALVPLTVINTHGFDLPGTGDSGTWLLTILGVLVFCGSVSCVVLLAKPRKKRTER